MVVEADESDGTFLKLRPTSRSSPTSIPSISITSRPSRRSRRRSRTSSPTVPFYGFAVMCIDHPVVQTLVGRIEDRRVVTYGENPQAGRAARSI
jgi:UDP-N-acetylmuramate--alanine ligase